MLLSKINFQTAICNGSHDVLMISMDLKDIDILNICGVDHCCIITGINKSEDMNLLINADLSEKKWITIIYNFLLQIKNEKRTCNVW